MTQNEYEKLADDLQHLQKMIPLNWGCIQNNNIDNKINMFQINSFNALEEGIANFSENEKKYFRRRWFLWKCAQCDEHLFAINTNVIQNPNTKDQSYDIEFNNNLQLRFDVKGTVFPKSFRNSIEEVLNNPTNLIQFFYDKQSNGVRNNYQNRLFIVHHSHMGPEREMYLRCHWEFKKQVYLNYSSRITIDADFINYKKTKSDVIFIIENLDKTMSYVFFAV